MRNFFKRNRTLLILFLIVLVAVSGFLYIRGASAEAPSQYQTSTIERGNLTATIGATGTVRAKQSAVLIWQAAGTVENVHTGVGESVSTQDVLAELSKTSLPQSVIMAEADLVSAQKSLDELMYSNTAQAEAVVALRDAQEAYDKALNYYDSLFNPYEYDRIVYVRKVTPFGVKRIPEIKTVKVKKADEKTIEKAGQDLALSEARLADAQRTYDLLEDGNSAEITAAQARVDAARATLNLARLMAPFDATVTESYPLPGDQVSAGATAFRLDDLSSLFVDVQVSEVDINSVQIGQPATLTFDAILDREYHGEVVEVSQVGTADQGVVNFEVSVELRDANSSVKPGMTAAVNIVVEEIQGVVLVPNRAVRLVDGERVVYLLVDGQSVKKEIRLGSSSDTMSVVAVGDVKEGDVVILNPPSLEFGPGNGPGGGFGG